MENVKVWPLFALFCCANAPIGSANGPFAVQFPKRTSQSVAFVGRICWLLIVVLSAYGAGSLILNSWQRYNANPTVISLEKDFREWNLSFPAATVCFTERLNDTLAEEYILERWGIEPNTSQSLLYKRFLNSVVNLTYENMHEFSQYLDNEELMSIKGEEMAEIARKVMVEMQFHATIFNAAYKNLTFVETLTEMGICFTYGGIVTGHISLANNPHVSRKNLPQCNYLNSLCYARIEDLPVALRYYIHSPTEIPDSSEKYFEVNRNMERDTTFRFQETVASKDLRRLDPMQRQCRFTNEPVGNDKAYTYNLCRMNCRKRLAVKYCGCAPYFYLKEEGIAVCDAKGLACLAKYAQSIVRLMDADNKRVKCSCVFQCQTTDYYIDKNSERRWTYPVPCNIRFRWAIEHYSKTRHKRDIIYGFEDLLVSLGGTAALFLGCSVISFVEIVYFLTLRLFWYIVNNCKN